MFLGALAGLAGGVPMVRAADADEIKLLREQIRALEQRLDELEKKQERAAAETAAAAAAAPKVSVSDKGLSLASADSANVPRLRALISTAVAATNLLKVGELEERLAELEKSGE